MTPSRNLGGCDPIPRINAYDAHITLLTSGADMDACWFSHGWCHGLTPASRHDDDDGEHWTNGGEGVGGQISTTVSGWCRDDLCFAVRFHVWLQHWLSDVKPKQKMQPIIHATPNSSNAKANYRYFYLYKCRGKERKNSVRGIWEVYIDCDVLLCVFRLLQQEQIHLEGLNPGKPRYVYIQIYYVNFYHCFFHDSNFDHNYYND